MNSIDRKRQKEAIAVRVEKEMIRQEKIFQDASVVSDVTERLRWFLLDNGGNVNKIVLRAIIACYASKKDLWELTDREWMNFRGIGNKTLPELHKCLDIEGLRKYLKTQRG